MIFLQKYGFLAGGYILAAFLFWLYVGAKQDLGAEIEACNTRAQAAAREAREAVSAAVIDSYEIRLAELESIAKSESEARQIAESAARIAADRPERVRTVIKEVESENSCVNTVVPDVILDSLREGASGSETRDRRGSHDPTGWNTFGLDAPTGAPENP